MSKINIDNSKYASFTPGEKSKSLDGVTIREAKRSDVKALAEIRFERESGQASLEDYILRFDDEIKEGKKEDWRLYVAEVDGETVGYGRLVYISDPAPNPYPKPCGWWLSGVSVKSEYRRHNIGRKLVEARLNFVRQTDEDLYYMSNAKNKTSIKLHNEFGFVKVSEAEGYGDVSFDGGLGYLFKWELK